MILAAAQILATDGPLACTVDEVARRSGVAKTTIYRHFQNSDALVLAVVDSSVKETPGPNTGSLSGDLKIIINGYLKTAEALANRRLFIWMLTRSMADPDFATKFRSVRIQPLGRTMVALQRAIARGEVPPETDLSLAMHLVQGPFMSKRIIENEQLTRREVDTLVDMIVSAFTYLPLP